MKKFLLLVIGLSLTLLCEGNVRLPKIFNNNMVLQRNKPINIWGWADANEKIVVQFMQQSKATKADKAGKWMVTLAPAEAGGPYVFIIKGKNTIEFNNVLIGEVWICSGQSNMEWTVNNVNHAKEEIAQANFPEIRQFLVQKSVSAKPEDDVTGGDWKVCSPENVGNFTAVGYFFARELYQSLKVPIGLVNTSWGGTHSETWTSRAAFEQSDEFKTMISKMPTLDLEALAKQRRAEQERKLKEMNVEFPAQHVEQWNQLTYPDDHWKAMTLPGLWEQQGLEDLDGVVWFRKTISIPAADAEKEAMLELSMIDDSDESYINGERVGSTTNKYNEKRKYKIPAGLLKEGRNVVVVRVDDTGGGGGIYGDPQDMKLTLQSGAVVNLSGKWSFAIESISESNATIGPNSYPTLLFNAMINPLLPLRIQGAIWYQGESNAGRAFQYRKEFPLMIQDWRNHWNQGDFPFYFVQLASFNADNGTSERGSTWAELREAQRMTLSLPNTGMAVTTDIGQANDIHPRNKQDVGKRLASIALHDAYSKDIVYSGPSWEKMKIESNTIRLSFTQVGSGLLVKDKYGYIKGFEVAGSDQKFHYAKAWLSGNDVIVSADAVSAPVAVRYGWADNPEDANLFNKEGFPASPFRTDSWPGITENAKFTIE